MKMRTNKSKQIHMPSHRQKPSAEESEALIKTCGQFLRNRFGSIGNAYARLEGVLKTGRLSISMVAFEEIIVAQGHFCRRRSARRLFRLVSGPDGLVTRETFLRAFGADPHEVDKNNDTPAQETKDKKSGGHDIKNDVMTTNQQSESIVSNINVEEAALGSDHFAMSATSSHHQSRPYRVCWTPSDRDGDTPPGNPIYNSYSYRSSSINIPHAGASDGDDDMSMSDDSMSDYLGRAEDLEDYFPSRFATPNGTGRFTRAFRASSNGFSDLIPRLNLRNLGELVEELTDDNTPPASVSQISATPRDSVVLEDVPCRMGPKSVRRDIGSHVTARHSCLREQLKVILMGRDNETAVEYEFTTLEDAPLTSPNRRRVSYGPDNDIDVTGNGCSSTDVRRAEMRQENEGYAREELEEGCGDASNDRGGEAGGLVLEPRVPVCGGCGLELTVESPWCSCTSSRELPHSSVHVPLVDGSIGEAFTSMGEMPRMDRIDGDKVGDDMLLPCSSVHLPLQIVAESQKRRMDWLDRLQRFCENALKCRLISCLRYVRKTQAWHRFIMYVRILLASRKMLDKARDSETYAEMKRVVNDFSESVQNRVSSLINANRNTLGQERLREAS